MGRRQKLDYEVHTPTAETLRAEVRGSERPGEAPPMVVHSWFDFQRNVMVVEVEVERPSPDQA